MAGTVVAPVEDQICTVGSGGRGGVVAAGEAKESCPAGWFYLGRIGFYAYGGRQVAEPTIGGARDRCCWSREADIPTAQQQLKPRGGSIIAGTLDALSGRG